MFVIESEINYKKLNWGQKGDKGEILMAFAVAVVAVVAIGRRAPVARCAEADRRLR